MGLFDKLFGSSGSEVLNKIKNTAQSLAEDAGNAISSAVNSASSAINPEAHQNASTGSYQTSSEMTSGFSWGPEMPSEENQYNYSGSYDQYFYDIYEFEFPSYRLTRETVRKGTATVITFWRDAQKALVVELMSDTSTAESIRNNCRREGVPYLRFYYNHEGWWNTRSYVIERTRNALKD